jgi:hypothetical protein
VPHRGYRGRKKRACVKSKSVPSRVDESFELDNLNDPILGGHASPKE